MQLLLFISLFLICAQSAAFPFLLTRFYYKIPVLRKKESDNHYPSELVSEIRQYFVLRSYNLEISPLLAALRSFAARSYIRRSPRRSLRRTSSVTSRYP